MWTCRVRSAFKTSGTPCTKSMACKRASDNGYAVETHVNEPQRKNLKWLKSLEEKQASHLIRQFQGSILRSLRILNGLSGGRLALVAEAGDKVLHLLRIYIHVTALRVNTYIYSNNIDV